MKPRTTLTFTAATLLGAVLSANAAHAQTRGQPRAATSLTTSAGTARTGTIGVIRPGTSVGAQRIAQSVAAPAVHPTRAQLARTQLDAAKRRMTDYIRTDEDTPEMEFVHLTDGAAFAQTQTPDYDRGRPAKYVVTGLAATGKLDLVTLLPVSGHNGWADAQQYAKANRYNVVVTSADGRRTGRAGIAAQGLITEHPVALELKRGTTVIEFWADGSGGVGGYVSGRRIELTWNGN